MNTNKKLLICSLLLGLIFYTNSLPAAPFEENQKVSIQAETQTSELETADITVKEEKTSEEQKKKEETSSDSSAKTEEIEGIVQVGNSCLRLREYPWGPVLGTYTTSTKCTIIGEEGEFYKVNINGTIGYMHKNFVSTSKQPASEIEPDYPGNCRRGGYIARTTSSGNSSNNKVADSKSSNSSNSNSKVEVKTSVIGQPAGDGTAAGAVTWAKDQMAGGSKKGLNRNNKKTSSDPKCWNYWCGAFVGTAWGHKVPQMCAGSAYGQYKNFKRDGMIHTDKNPPAGAIMFTGPTATNEYGHVFLASGEVDANGEPIVITSGWNGHDGITTMTLSKMIGRNTYLGWAMPE